MAPGNEATKKILMDEARRPSKKFGTSQFDLDVDKFLHNLRTVRKGFAGGPSGMTAQHLEVGLESPVVCGLVGEVACQVCTCKDAGRSGSGDSSREDHSTAEARWWGERHRGRGFFHRFQQVR